MYCFFLNSGLCYIFRGNISGFKKDGENSELHEFSESEDGRNLLTMMSFLQLCFTHHLLPNPFEMSMNVMREENKEKLQTLAARLGQLLNDEQEMYRALSHEEIKLVTRTIVVKM